jgi:cytoskeletal protein CcmA (bactofilin family)
MNDPKNSATEKRTLVEEGTTFKGSLQSTCPIHVQGSIEGDVIGPAVTVSPTGAVSGMVEASSLKSAGKISGEFDVESAQLAGTVAKNTVIRANSLDLKLSVTGSKLQLTFGQQDGARKKS